MTISVTSANGNAPPGALSPLPGSNGDGSPHLAATATAQSYARIRQGMLNAGLGDLVPSDGYSCYRDRDDQQHMIDLGLTTAPVGTSIHGEWTYGCAVDFSGLGGFGAPRHEWLRDNGGPHGWYQPGWAQANGSLPEAWHWEHDSRNDQHTNEVPGGFLMALTDAEQANLYARIINLDQQVTGADSFTPSVAARVVNVDRQLTGADGLSPSLGSRIIHTDQQTTGADATAPSIASRVIGIESATVGVGSSQHSSWSPRAILALILAVILLVIIVVGPIVLDLPDESQPWFGVVAALSGALTALLTTRGRGRHARDDV